MRSNSMLFFSSSLCIFQHMGRFILANADFHLFILVSLRMSILGQQRAICSYMKMNWILPTFCLFPFLLYGWPVYGICFALVIVEFQRVNKLSGEEDMERCDFREVIHASNLNPPSCLPCKMSGWAVYQSVVITALNTVLLSLQIWGKSFISGRKRGYSTFMYYLRFRNLRVLKYICLREECKCKQQYQHMRPQGILAGETIREQSIFACSVFTQQSFNCYISSFVHILHVIGGKCINLQGHQ